MSAPPQEIASSETRSLSPESGMGSPESGTARRPFPTQRSDRGISIPLPADRLERVGAWGMSTSAMEYVYRPSTDAGIREVFEVAREHGMSIGLRGAGRSYGDASL